MVSKESDLAEMQEKVTTLENKVVDQERVFKDLQETVREIPMKISRIKW